MSGESAFFFAQEEEEGNIEYKWKLVNPTADRFDHLVTQLKYRMGEGRGEAIYRVGVEDDGNPRGLPEKELEQSLDTVRAMAKELSAEMLVLRVRKGVEGDIAECLVRYLAESCTSKILLRLAVIGNVDSGKSTLIGVLTHGALDNGRGSARLHVFRHKHEIENGRTSSISQQMVGFDTAGKIMNCEGGGGGGGVKKLTQQEILQASTKLLDFVDLCGHERYLKTTIRGLTGNAPDYCMLMLGANMGVQRMTKEHLGVSLSLKLPTFVIITKIDISPEHVTEKTTKRICRILKSPAAGKKMPVLIRNIDDVMTVVQNCASGRVVPIFRISCVSGKNLDLLKLFLNLLPNNKEWKRLHSLPAEFSIDGSYQVTGVGTVVSGTLFQGRIHLGDELLLGPSPKWRRVIVKGIHTNRVPIQHAEAGMSASFHVKSMDSREKLKKNHVRKGMVLVTPSPPPQTVRFFEAEVVILHHPTTIKERYEPVIHCRTVRQSAIVVSMSKSLLRTGQSAKVLFKFSHHPEFITVGSQILFREGRTKGLGEICAVFANEDEASASQLWK